MDDKRQGKLKVWTPLLFSIMLIAGMVLGFNLRDTLRTKRDIQTIVERNDRLEQIIDLISEKYVDTVNSNLLYEDAINGILSHLDPHTVYITADEYDDMNEDLEGGFFGIGVEFSIIRDTIQVTSVIENGPAEHAGVHIGDQLIKVGDSIVAGKGITSERIIKMLKGKQYSRVYVTLKEQETGKAKIVPIKRDIVPLYSVEADIMLDSITGFIKIDRFAATTYDEFSKAMKKLQGQGMKQLIVDVRQNPGGYLDAATNIADEFLDDEKLIVYTEGKSSPRIDYKAQRDGMFEKGKLAILVDETSASASEILAGALQDWDRAVIIGRTSYGKGLVQEQYDMDDGSGLRLTIAKYYTPSGRSIQRSFAKGKDAYAEEFAKRFESGELTGKVPDTQEDTVQYYTSKKRIVYGGGGIKPDIYVPYDTNRLSSGVLNLVYGEEVKNFTWDYFLRNRAALARYKTIKSYDKGFDAAELVERYMTTLNPQMRKTAKSILSAPANMAYFQGQLKAQLGRILFRNNGYFTVQSHNDNVVQRALQVLHGRQYSALISR
jgi:carboxyl-terminal processing protease